MQIRRMFHGKVVQSKDFFALSRDAQLLYFHLGMLADEDGFVTDAEIMRCRLGMEEAALEELIRGKYLFSFGEIVVIRHFLVANTLRNDRAKPLQFPEIARKIYVNQEKIYSLTRTKNAVLLTTFKQRALRTAGKPKVALNNNSNSNNNNNRNITTTGEQEHPPWEAGEDDPLARGDRFKIMGGVLGQGVIRLTDDQMDDLMERMGIDGFNHYVKKLAEFIIGNHATVNNHYATICKWWEEDKGYGKKFEPMHDV